MTSIEMYEKKVLELFHMYANGDIDIREFLTTIHNFYYKVEEMYKLEMAQLPQQEISDEESQVFDTENLTVPIDARDEAFEILRHNIMIAPVDREYRIKLLTSLSNYIETLKP